MTFDAFDQVTIRWSDEERTKIQRQIHDLWILQVDILDYWEISIHENYNDLAIKSDTGQHSQLSPPTNIQAEAIIVRRQGQDFVVF